MEEEIYSSFEENKGTKSENNIAITSDIVENNDNDFDDESTSFPDLQSIEPPVDNDNDNGDSETNDEDTNILDTMM
eukprot:Awhi_evm1s14136